MIKAHGILALLCAALALAPTSCSAAPQPRAAAARIPVVSQNDMLARGAVDVLVRARQSARLRVDLRLQDGRSVVVLARGRTLAARRGSLHTLTFTLSPVGREALGRCVPQRIVVFASAAGGVRREITSRPVSAEPPRCGRFFGPQAVWNTPLAPDAPLDATSPQVTQDLLRQVDAEFATGPAPTINTSVFSSPVYTVTRTQPTLRVALDRPPGAAPLLEAQLAQVPLPADARPAAGTDEHLVVWQPATDTMWEFWQLRHAADGWHAGWGGRLDHVSLGPGHFVAPDADHGATATSLPLAGGLITIGELSAGNIDHALALAVPDVRAGVAALPAQRSDGVTQSSVAVPEGARFRLDPALDLDALGLPAPTLAIARAAQRYGMIVRDRAGVVALYAQDPTPTGTDPYARIFGGAAPQDLLRAFPWHSLRLVKMELRQVPGPARSCGALVCP